MTDIGLDARRAAEDTARRSYGKLLAYLAARSRDIASCEDALAEAFAQALSAWPVRGLPNAPEAWLLTAARRNLGKGARHARVRAGASAALAILADEWGDRDLLALPDRRLELLFACAHPAIDSSARIPLMLQTVLGLDAARIASAFLVSPAAMGQRLTRAKSKIRDAGIAFELPQPEDLAPRLDDVCEAIYAAYTAGWDDAFAGQRGAGELAREAVFLGTVLADSLPGQPETLGLLALMTYAQARQAARRDSSGAFVPLDDQDTSLWDRNAIAEAETLLARASSFKRPGRFQTEAAIQSFHVARRAGAPVDWRALDALYEALSVFAPTLGAEVGRAAAKVNAGEAAAALDRLDALPKARADYQPYWAVRGAALEALGRPDDARAAYARAAGLSADPAVRARLLSRL